MSLRAFATNPLGGFTPASSSTSPQSRTSSQSPAPSSLPQALKELLENAIDTKSGEVGVRISSPSPGAPAVQLEVLDLGGGMDVERSVQAFSSTKAAQGDGTTAGRFGIGLTLAILHAYGARERAKRAQKGGARAGGSGEACRFARSLAAAERKKPPFPALASPLSCPFLPQCSLRSPPP
jgi:hypothetical protein